MEPTVAELSDGRLLMLIRTHWGRFWEALSDDGGLSWRHRPAESDRVDQRAGLPAEAAQRSAGSRLERQGRACQSAVGFFPKMTARHGRSRSSLPLQKDGQLSYPYCLERCPGELWVIAGFAFKKGWQEPVPLRLKITEEQFLSEAKKGSRG